MAIIVRTCCCGCDLRTGILLIGIFGLVSAFEEFASSCISVACLRVYAWNMRRGFHLAVQSQSCRCVIFLSQRFARGPGGFWLTFFFTDSFYLSLTFSSLSKPQIEPWCYPTLNLQKSKVVSFEIRYLSVGLAQCKHFLWRVALAAFIL